MSAPDPARRAAFEVLKAVRVKGAYTNLVLPHQLGKYRLSGRDAAFATELASGTIRRQGTYDAILAACTDRPLAQHRGQGPRRPPARVSSAARDARRAPRGDQHQRRPGPLRVRPRPGRIHQRRAAQGVRLRSRDLAHPHRRRPLDPVLPPRLGGRGADRGRRRRGGDRRAARGRQRRPVGHPGGPARTRDAFRAAWQADGLLAVRRRLRRRRPRRVAGRGRRAGGGAGRGVPARGTGPGLCSDRGPRRPVARPLRRTGRQGGATGSPGRRARRARRGERGAAASCRPGTPGAGSRLRSTGESG